MQVNNNVSVKELNTFNIDVNAQRIITCQTLEEVLAAQKLICDTPFLVLGGGSNVLFMNDYNGTIIRPEIVSIETLDETSESVTLRIGAGVVWDDFVAYCVDNLLYGVENLSAIPGNVGAAPVQNIGAYGAEAKDTIIAVHGVMGDTGALFSLKADECHFGYRHSIFKTDKMKKAIITHVDFRLKRHAELNMNYADVASVVDSLGNANITNLRKAIITIRERKLPDPKVEGNAGSFFKNPEIDNSKANNLLKLYPTMPHFDLGNGTTKVPAGWLIDQCGWKGKQLGKAGVHAHQALVIVNKGGATSADIMNVANAVVADVKDKFGIEIEMEVNKIY